MSFPDRERRFLTTTDNAFLTAWEALFTGSPDLDAYRRLPPSIDLNTQTTPLYEAFQPETIIHRMLQNQLLISTDAEAQLNAHCRALKDRFKSHPSLPTLMEGHSIELYHSHPIYMTHLNPVTAATILIGHGSGISQNMWYEESKKIRRKLQETDTLQFTSPNNGQTFHLQFKKDEDGGYSIHLKAILTEDLAQKINERIEQDIEDSDRDESLRFLAPEHLKTWLQTHDPKLEHSAISIPTAPKEGSHESLQHCRLTPRGLHQIIPKLLKTGYTNTRTYEDPNEPYVLIHPSGNFTLTFYPPEEDKGEKLVTLAVEYEEDYRAQRRRLRSRLLHSTIEGILLRTFANDKRLTNPTINIYHRETPHKDIKGLTSSMDKDILGYISSNFGSYGFDTNEILEELHTQMYKMIPANIRARLSINGLTNLAINTEHGRWSARAETDKQGYPYMKIVAFPSRSSHEIERFQESIPVLKDAFPHAASVGIAQNSIGDLYFVVHVRTEDEAEEIDKSIKMKEFRRGGTYPIRVEVAPPISAHKNEGVELTPKASQTVPRSHRARPQQG